MRRIAPDVCDFCHEKMALTLDHRLYVCGICGFFKFREIEVEIAP